MVYSSQVMSWGSVGTLQASTTPTSVRSEAHLDNHGPALLRLVLIRHLLCSSAPVELLGAPRTLSLTHMQWTPL